MLVTVCGPGALAPLMAALSASGATATRFICLHSRFIHQRLGLTACLSSIPKARLPGTACLAYTVGDLGLRAGKLASGVGQLRCAHHKYATLGSMYVTS